MSRVTLNWLLLGGIVVLTPAAWLLQRDFSQPNYVFTPEMVFSIPYDSYAVNQNFPDGKTMQAPLEGVVAQGTPYFDYQATEADAQRAADELLNPWAGEDIDADAMQAASDRGRTLYTRFCLPCHGPMGKGDGTVAQRGFPAPPPFTSENSLNMSDGRMFHIITFGQQFLEGNNMPAYDSQIAPEDRWKIILHVRSLQTAATQAAEQAAAEQAAAETDADQPNTDQPNTDQPENGEPGVEDQAGAAGAAGAADDDAEPTTDEGNEGEEQ